MLPVGEFGKYGPLGLALLALAVLGYIARGFFTYLSISQRSHDRLTESFNKNTQALSKLSKSSDKTAEASAETLRFMKNLNGKLEKATAEKVKEVRE